MRLIILSLVALPLSAAGAQTQTRCIRQDIRTVDCATTGTAPTLDGYSKALGAGRNLVPDYQEQERSRQQIEQLHLQNEVLRRQLEVQAAPGYDPKQSAGARRPRSTVAISFSPVMC